MHLLLAQAAYHPESMSEALLSVIAFGAVGLVLAIVGFKLFDWITPGNLGEEITRKQNIAASIMAGSVIIGISIILHAAIHG